MYFHTLKSYSVPRRQKNLYKNVEKLLYMIKLLDSTGRLCLKLSYFPDLLYTKELLSFEVDLLWGCSSGADFKKLDRWEGNRKKIAVTFRLFSLQR